MAKSRIEGITIEIDGNTKPLKAALESVNKSIGNTRDSLRDVDRLLKLDPGNTELLSQKQHLLSEAIEGTEEKLKQLKTAQQQAQAQLEKGELGKDKYDALQREIAATESSLENLKSQAKTTAADLNGFSNGMGAISSAAEKAAGKVSGLSKAAGGLLGAAAATVPATEELWRDLSFLEKNSKNAGVGIKATEEAFKTFNAVSGETDSSVEAVSNLLQAGFTESNLQTAVEGISGAVSDFPDTLKIESMADSVQETIATGKSIGQFSEYLDRAGIGAENFDKELENCSTAAERQDRVLEALAKGGGNESYNAWKKSNPELVKYQDTMLEMQTTLKDFAVNMAPVITKVTEFATKAVDGFNKLSPAAQDTALALTGITAAAGPTLSGAGKVAGGIKTLSDTFSKATTGAQGLSGGSKVLSGALKAVPYVAVAAGAVGLAAAIYEGIDAMNAETDAANEAAETRRKAVESVKTETKETDLYFQKLKELEAVEDKTATQKQLMQEYVDKLNESVEDLNLSYDDEKDKLSQSTDAIYKRIEAQKQEAVQAVYLKQSQKALEDYAETQIKLADKQAELTKKEEEYKAILDKGSSITQDELRRKNQLREETKELKREVDDLTNASDKYNREAQKLTNQAELQGEAWKDLLKEAEMTAEDIPKTLMEGIESGQYAIPKSVEELNALIKFDKAVKNAQDGGKKVAKELSDKIASGEISVTEATKELTQANARELEKGATTAGQKGGKTGSNYAYNLKSKMGESQAAGKANSDSANTGLDSADTAGTGRTKGAQFASGVSSKTDAASGAGETLSKAGRSAAAAISFTATGQSKGAQLTSGILKKKDATSGAGTTLSKAGRSAAKEISWVSAGKNAGKGYIKGLNLSLPAIVAGGEAVAKAALKAAKKVAKEGSPAKEWIKSAEFAGEGYAIGFYNSVPLVKRAGEAVADAVLSGATKADKALADIGTNDFSSMKSQIKTDLDYSRLGSIMKSSLADMEFTIILDQREVGRGLRGMGVQFQ